MGSYHGSRRVELKQLELQLAQVNLQLDAMEQRSAHRRTGANMVEAHVIESPETRFAACVASGMSKLLSSVKSEN